MAAHTGSLGLVSESLGLGWTWREGDRKRDQRPIQVTPVSAAGEHPVCQHHGPPGEDHRLRPGTEVPPG